MKTAKHYNQTRNAVPFTRTEVAKAFLAWKANRTRMNRHKLVYVTLCAVQSKTRINLPMLGASAAVHAIEATVAPYEVLLAEFHIDADVMLLRFKKHANPMPLHATEILGK